MNCNYFIKFIENKLNDSKKNEIKKEDEKLNEEDLHSYKQSVGENKNEGNKKDIISNSSKEHLEKNEINPSKEEDSEEEKLLQMAKEIFDLISKIFIDKQINVYKYFEKDITKNEGIEVIETNKFLEGLKNSGLKELSEQEIICIIKVLAADEEAKYIKISDFEQILSDYKLNDSKSNELQGLDFNELDNVSLVILLALTEYLLQGKIHLYNLFEGFIKEIKDEEGNSYEVISSLDFFKILEKIGIKMEEKEYQNLRDFLSISTENNEFLAISSIKLSIEELASNTELNEKARKFYEEIQGELGESSEISE